VFGNNNSTLREMFFTNTTLLKLWDKVVKTMKKEHVFEKDPNPDLELTYRMVTQEVTRYGIALPSFWAK